MVHELMFTLMFTPWQQHRCFLQKYIHQHWREKALVLDEEQRCTVGCYTYIFTETWLHHELLDQAAVAPDANYTVITIFSLLFKLTPMQIQKGLTCLCTYSHKLLYVCAAWRSLQTTLCNLARCCCEDMIGQADVLRNHELSSLAGSTATITIVKSHCRK